MGSLPATRHLEAVTAKTINRKNSMKTIKLTNSFHNTKTIVRVPDSWSDDPCKVWEQIQWLVHCNLTVDRSDRRKYNRIRNALCGSKDCTCGIVR